MDTLIMMWACMLFLIVVAFVATRKLALVPGKAQVACEAVINMFYGFADTMVGEKGRAHVPLAASLFLFILTANLSGQLPLRLFHLKEGEFASPTNDINMTAAMAIIVLIYYIVVGIKAKGFRFIYHGLSFNGIILTLVDLLEMITRPLSLAIRLYANILAGEILVTIVLGACAYAAPIPVMLFEILVAFIQAVVFMMLTFSYISSSVNDEH
ncbi:F0F1 ATP synthase subunit A [bacterium]|nr:F0F1 ATP synthase subunit A [bacterium]